MKTLALLPAIFIASVTMAQTRLPVIKATSRSVAIKDGDLLDKNAWSLSPKIKPDVYTADRSRQTKWVTFYTDIDSIRVKVKPGGRYNFVILLNGKDSCFTQIASAIPPENKVKRQPATHDTIPFALTAYNAIAVKTIVNSTDTLTFHFDTGSWDCRITQDALVQKLHNAKISKLQMGHLVWNRPEVANTGLTAHDMDGRFGWNLFEGKTVEINYDRSLLIIHSQPLKIPKGYAKSELLFLRSFVCAEGAFEVNHKTYTGNFLLDTGSDLPLVLDKDWAARQNFPADLKLLKTVTFNDPKGNKYETKIVQSPLFKINGFALSNVPASILSIRNPARFEINTLGNDVLKRFNMILDFKNDAVYLKPNHLMKASYLIHS